MQDLFWAFCAAFCRKAEKEITLTTNNVGTLFRACRKIARNLVSQYLEEICLFYLLLSRDVVDTFSLAMNPSVPGPEYFDDGFQNVTNASKPLYS